MGHSFLTEKQVFGVAGALAAAAIEAGLSPATALVDRIARLFERAASMPGSAAFALALAVLAFVSLGALAYARPLSRKAAVASGFCAIAVLALLAP